MPKTRATALGGAAEAARAAGASEEVVAVLAREAEDAKQEAASGRQLGARLDSHRAAVRKLMGKVAAAEKTVEDALARCEAARDELDLAKAALADVEAEVAQNPRLPQPDGATPTAVEDGTRDLLEALERAPLASCPESVLAAMRSLHALLHTNAVMTATPALDEALPEERRAGTAELLATAPAGEPREVTGEDGDELMPGALKRASEEFEDDAALGAHVRAELRRSTRSRLSPY